MLSLASWSKQVVVADRRSIWVMSAIVISIHWDRANRLGSHTSTLHGSRFQRRPSSSCPSFAVQIGGLN